MCLFEQGIDCVLNHVCWTVHWKRKKVFKNKGTKWFIQKFKTLAPPKKKPQLLSVFFAQVVVYSTKNVADIFYFVIRVLCFTLLYPRHFQNRKHLGKTVALWLSSSKSQEWESLEFSTLCHTFACHRRKVATRRLKMSEDSLMQKGESFIGDAPLALKGPLTSICRWVALLSWNIMAIACSQSGGVKGQIKTQTN